MDKKAGSFQGCLLGCALGDALGAPVEFRSQKAVDLYLSKHLRPKDFRQAPACAVTGQPFGYITDDTYFLHELACALIEGMGVFQPDLFARRIARFSSNGNLHESFGGGTKTALVRLLAGISWQRSGEDSAGNGAAVRAAPLGLALFDVNEILQKAVIQARITHKNAQAEAASACMALAAFLAARKTIEVDLHAKDFGLFLASHLEALDPEFSKHLRKIAGYVRQDLDPVKTDQWCLEYIYKEVQDHNDSEGITPYCYSSVLWALYAFLRTPHDMWATLVRAISPGGDTDTLGAMAGTLSGIHNGCSQIPQSLLERLTDGSGRGYREWLLIADGFEEVATVRCHQDYRLTL
jgi:ADP-ribosylglycohydrolase